MSESHTPTELVDHREENGAQLELHRRGEAYEVRIDGRPAFASAARGSEQALVDLTMTPLRGRDDVTVLLAGLGMGLTLRHLLDAQGVKVTRVDVVEGSPAIVEWEARHFAALNGDALKDARVKLHATDLASFLRQPRGDDGWFAVLLDLDAGPGGLERADNAQFYTDEGVAALEAALRPGGVLTLWSPQREPELMKRMHARLQSVAEMLVPVEIEGKSSLDYVYRGRRHPPPPAAAPAAPKPAN